MAPFLSVYSSCSISSTYPSGSSREPTSKLHLSLSFSCSSSVRPFCCNAASNFSFEQSTWLRPFLELCGSERVQDEELMQRLNMLLTGTSGCPCAFQIGWLRHGIRWPWTSRLRAEELGVGMNLSVYSHQRTSHITTHIKLVCRLSVRVYNS